tara:strand:+ start:388 stop:2058 length:1671 start_codon:yes stop_codon:yes gene_type:complete
MADDTLRLGIEADASGVDRGVKQAKDSLSDLGDSVDRESKNLNRYGEKLGKAFGPGEGLHGRLSELETPLRDSEGAFARAQMAVIEFGNEGATAADKIGAGFLLAGDSIAAFASGGVVGIAIAAGVAGLSMLVQAMNEEAEAAKKAEEETKKQAEALKALADAALSAGVSLAAQRSLQEVTAQSSKLLEVDDKLLENRRQQIKLLKELDVAENEQLRLAEASGILLADIQSGELRLGDARKEASAELRTLRQEEKKLSKDQVETTKQVEKASSKAADERIRFSDTATKRIIDDARRLTAATKQAIKEITKPQTSKKADSEITAVEKEAQAALERVRKQTLQEAAFERQVRKDNAAFNLQTAQQTAEAERAIRFAAFAEQAALDEAAHDQRRQRAEEAIAFDRKLAEERTQMAMAAANTVTGALFEQAKAGELNASKLLEAVLASTGQELVARGTLHAFEGVATANPIMAGTGAAMIASGLAMGAASGAVSRAGQPAATPSSTPTDTRQSRAASTAGSSEGGTTVINFNGDAYDRRGVSNVLNSGLKMARHRRVMGA